MGKDWGEAGRDIRLAGMTPSEAERKGRKVGQKDLRLKYSSEKGHQGILCLQGMGLFYVHATLSWEQPMEACCWQEGVGDFRSQQLGPWASYVLCS